MVFGMTAITRAFALPLQPVEHPNPDIKILFERMDEDEILACIEEAIRLKNPSVLYVICQIPNKKLGVLNRLKNFSEIVELCVGDEIERFLNCVTADQLAMFRKIPLSSRYTFEEMLKIFILKANNPNATLAAKAHQILICMPPLMLLIAIKAGMDMVSLSRYMSPKQLRFLAQHADESYIIAVFTHLAENNQAAKVYILALALPEQSSTSFTFSQYADRFNHQLHRLKFDLNASLLDVKMIMEELNKREAKAPVTRYFLLKKEEIKRLEQVNEFIERVTSLTFDAIIAGFKRAPQKISSDVVENDSLIKEISNLLLDFNRSSARITHS